MSQSGKSHKAANVSERQKSHVLNGKCPKKAKVLKRQKSQNGKCLKAAIVPSWQKSHIRRDNRVAFVTKGKSLITANVLEGQMSHKGKCLTWHLSQMAKGTLLKSMKGKCPKAAFVSEGKWPCEAFGT